MTDRDTFSAWQLVHDNERLRDEVARLKEAIRRLAEQDATLSVCNGNVTVTMDATLTAAEREAVEWCVEMAATTATDCADEIAALRGLLARTAKPDTTQPMNGTPDGCSVPDLDTNSDEPNPDPERFNEWLRRPYYVDPPQGWRYGFPRLYDPAHDGNLTEWLIANGYPETLARKGLPCTFTACTDSQ